MSERNSAWRNPWVIGWIALVLVVLLANLIMIYLAVSTSPGLVVDDYYERGRNYEKTIMARRAKSAELSLHVDVPPIVRVNRPAVYRFTGAYNNGSPLRADAVTLFAYRPSDAGADFSVPMVVETEGRYRAEATFPLPGIWDIIVSLRLGEDEHNVPQRIEVKSEK